MKPLRHIIYIGVLLLTLACSGSKKAAETSTDTLAWLQEIKEYAQEHKAPCRIILYEKEGESYYSVYLPTPGVYDRYTTTVYNQAGEVCLKYGGLMPPQRQAEVNKFFETAQEERVLWEYNLPQN